MESVIRTRTVSPELRILSLGFVNNRRQSINDCQKSLAIESSCSGKVMDLIQMVIHVRVMVQVNLVQATFLFGQLETVKPQQYCVEMHVQIAETHPNIRPLPIPCRKAVSQIVGVAVFGDEKRGVVEYAIQFATKADISIEICNCIFNGRRRLRQRRGLLRW